MADVPPGSHSSVAQYKGRAIGRILRKMGKLSAEQVHEALAVQKAKRGPVGQILIDLGYIHEADLQLALAAQMGMEPVNLDRIDIRPEVIKLLPAQMAQSYRVIPVDYDEASHTLSVAIGSPDNFKALDDIKLLMHFNVRPLIATDDQVTQSLNRYYPEGGAESIQDLIDEAKGDDDLSAMEGRGESLDLEVLAQAADSAPVKKLLNLILLKAIREKAADVHFEPFEGDYKIRYRIDGVLYDMIPPPKWMAMALASRIKVMANLDIAERRLPQDGRIRLELTGSKIDLRVAVLPTMFGESIVMRILDRSAVSLELEKLGFREDDLAKYVQMIEKPHGVVIVTGPTGSGKTTTLYAGLNRLNTIDTKILTAEDPVEYEIDGLIQCQVNAEAGMTFARALRSFLRQDPDIILVGEVRDLETAQISVQASLTGHLVLTTVHTNDAPSTIARLVDLGLEPFLVTATLEGIVAQRLVRRICKHCRTEYTPTEQALFELELRPEDAAGRKFYVGKGCDYCNNTGYKGRTALYEVMTLDDPMRDMIMQRASTNVLRAHARKRGMRTLREAGLLAIFDGITSIDEVSRETLFDEG
ncbi:MAG: ATPase, T2SS/T4P/T4SS family [Phycisphaerae bacterium]